MRRNWRAPACYVSAALICLFCAWTLPLVDLADVLAGAGVGAALMWALNDWEIRRAARLHEQELDGQRASLLLRSRLRGAMHGMSDPGESEPSGEAGMDSDGMRDLAHAAGALEEHAKRVGAMPGSAGSMSPAGRGTPIDAWRREALARDIARMEAQLRALTEAAGEPPFGAPEGARSGVVPG